MDKKTQKFLDGLGLFVASEIVNDTQEAKESPVVPTGIPVLDKTLLKIGGFPKGRLIEIYGEPDSLKSATMYRILASYQKHFPEKMVAIIDTENVLSDAFGLKWVESQGVDLSRLVYTYMDSVEDIVNTLQALARSGEFSCIVLDSLGNPEVENNRGEQRFKEDKSKGGYKVDKIGEFSKRVGDGTKAIKREMAKTETTFIVINQVRASLDMYGPEFVTPGGFVFHHNRDISIQFSPKGDIRVNDEVVGKRIGISVERSKVCPKARTNLNNHFEFYFSEEKQNEAKMESMVLVAIDEGILSKGKTGWIEWGDEKIHGVPKFMKYLKENPAKYEELVNLINTPSTVDSEEYDELFTDQSEEQLQSSELPD